MKQKIHNKNKIEKKALVIMGKIEKLRELYKQLDEITEEAVEHGLPANSEIYVHDNFVDKNTQWRSTPMRRFEIKRK